MNSSKVLNHMNGRLTTKRGAARVDATSRITHDDLETIGISVRNMDAALVGGGPGGVPGHIPRNALETWFPGYLRTVTRVRNIDRIAGVSTVGKWEDEAIKLMVEEAFGRAEIYGDNTNIPLADIRHTPETRGVVRFELGFRVGELEGKRLSTVGIEVASSKRRAVSEALDVSRNAVGFSGYRSASTNIYGLLNDPSLPAYETHGNNGFGAVTWANATYNSIVSDFSMMFQQLVSQSGGNIQFGDNLVWVIPTKYLNILNLAHANTGQTVSEWVQKQYPGCRIENAPEFDDVLADGASYLFLETAGQYDDSEFEGATLVQAVPDRFRTLGSETQIKGYVEDCVNATAGVFVLRPWAFCRLDIS